MTGREKYANSKTGLNELPKLKEAFSGRNTFLVIEDALPVAQQIASFLRSIFGENSEVLIAGTYDEAITLFDKNSGRLRGVITDMSFPKNESAFEEERFGFDVIAHVKRNSKVPIIVQSDVDYSRDLRIREADGFFRKQDIMKAETQAQIRDLLLSKFRITAC